MTVQSAAPSLRVLAVDGHPVFRAGLRAIVDQAADLVWSGEAATVEDALAQAARSDPDVVVLDLRLSGHDGTSLAKLIAERHPAAGVLLLADQGDQATVISAVRAGARGCVPRRAGTHDVVRAIRAVGRGEAIFGTEVADCLLDLFGDSSPPAVRAFPSLTRRERDVLEQLAHGSTNGQIAQALGMSPKTVRNHLARVCTKLRVMDRAGALLRAREAGLGQEAPA